MMASCIFLGRSSGQLPNWIMDVWNALLEKICLVKRGFLLVECCVIGCNGSKGFFSDGGRFMRESNRDDFLCFCVLPIW